MQQVLRSLLNETRSRCVALAELIVSRDVHDFVAPLAVKSVRTFRELARDAESALLDPALSEPLLYPEFFQTQRRLAEKQIYFETELIPLILTFDERDALLTERARTLASDIGYPIDGLVVKAQAGASPFTIPAFRTIWVPASDVESALGWPDILHELGHILLTDHPEILGRFGGQVTALLDDQVRELRSRQAPQATIDRTRLVYTNWTAWAAEFAADLLATWVLGAAYPWANLRLCARLHRDVFRPSFEDLRPGSQSHPADHARMLMCIELCGRLGVEADAKRSLDAWESYLQVRQLIQPQGFTNCYPDDLRRALIQAIEGGAISIGLVPSTQAHDAVRSLQRLYQSFGTDAAGVTHTEMEFHSILGS